MADERPHEMIRRLAWNREPCACGEWIEVPSFASRQSGEVYVAVRRHNKRPAHQAWRARQEA